jgi:pimeloyl-ACP methyl ester carboxylesterase
MSDRPATDASILDDPAVSSEYREVNGVRLHVVTAGDEDDPLVVLLHGFPEFWYGWHRSIAPLVDAGYRVLVPDQRGYNRSEAPDGVRAYRITELSRDIAELIESEDRESAHVVGHDWGAGVAWDLALRRPAYLDHLGIVNVPHPTVFQETLTSNPRQLAKSWYMFYFQLPRIPEWVQAQVDYKQFVDSLRNAKPGTFSEADIERYRAVWDRGLTGMINWYRALFRYREDPPRERVEAPTLVIWGERDEYLLAEMAEKSIQYCDDGRLERVSEGTHWVHHEYAEEVTDHLLEHLG